MTFDFQRLVHAAVVFTHGGGIISVGAADIERMKSPATDAAKTG